MTKISPLAVCLLTCDRPELTAITVQSFVEHNRARLPELTLLHCDGGSATSENCDLAQAAGFMTLVAPPPSERIGQMATLRHFLDVVRARGLEFIVWLENDWESVAPLPTDAFVRLSGVETIRLFGVKKFRSGHRALAGRHRIGTNEPLVWVPATGRPGWEYSAHAHWGAGGTIVRTDVIEAHVAAGPARLKDVIMSAHDLRSLRPIENVMWSIGQQTTTGFLG